ncbi:hypothetical protein LX36DRAFT_704404 [Colletotrichum falcatum]|nr:hypothetical protein LX36DRAFT_704404 [Colletotrichum falcatum]
MTEEDVASHTQRTRSSLCGLRYYRGDDVPKLTPRNLGTVAAIGGNGAMPVGTASHVAGVCQERVGIADVDGFNIGHLEMYTATMVLNGEAPLARVGIMSRVALALGGSSLERLQVHRPEEKSQSGMSAGSCQDFNACRTAEPSEEAQDR